MARQVLKIPDLPPEVLLEGEAELKYLSLEGGVLSGPLEFSGPPGQTYRSAVLENDDAALLVTIYGGPTMRVTDGVVGPAPGSTVYLGESTNRWGRVYAGDGNFSGSVQADSITATSLLAVRSGGVLNGFETDARYLQLTGGAVSGALTVQGKAVAASPDAGNAVEFRSNGFWARGPSVLRDEEFTPGAGATTVTLAVAPANVLMVARNGVVQSQGAGNFSFTGAVVTFTDAFVAGERVQVVYDIGVTT